MWHRRGKTINPREIIFSQNFFAGTVNLVPETVKFWFSSQKQGLKWFYNTLNSENSIFSTIFWSISELSKCCKNTSSPSSKCCKIILHSVFDPKTKISPSQEPNEQFQKKISRKNNFPRILCFPSTMSHIHKSTKMRFPGNRPKMAQLHKNTTSSKMVAWGWYMTHFNRRDLLNSKKLVWDGFHNLPDLPGRFAIFLDFSEISRRAAEPRKPISQLL